MYVCGPQQRRMWTMSPREVAGYLPHPLLGRVHVCGSGGRRGKCESFGKQSLGDFSILRQVLKGFPGPHHLHGRGHSLKERTLGQQKALGSIATISSSVDAEFFTWELKEDGGSMSMCTCMENLYKSQYVGHQPRDYILEMVWDSSLSSLYTLQYLKDQQRDILGTACEIYR